MFIIVVSFAVVFAEKLIGVQVLERRCQLVSVKSCELLLPSAQLLYFGKD